MENGGGADVLIARRVVERIAGVLDHGGVARWIGVRAQPKRHFACVMHVAIFVHHDDVFGPAGAGPSAPCPQTAHDFVGCIGKVS
jgi:hypothetical protein